MVELLQLRFRGLLLLVVAVVEDRLHEHQLDRLERREQLLHERLGLDHVAVHDALELLLRRAEGLQRRLLLLRRRLVRERALKRQNLLDLRRVLELERAEQVALVDDGARRELVLERARLAQIGRAHV